MYFFLLFYLDIINEEMHNQKNYNIYTFETSEEKIKRIKGIVITQLTSFTYNMLSFEFPNDKVKDIVINFGKYYGLDNQKIEEILKSLEEYSQINENKIKVDFNKMIEMNRKISKQIFQKIQI